MRLFHLLKIFVSELGEVVDDVLDDFPLLARRTKRRLVDPDRAQGVLVFRPQYEHGLAFGNDFASSIYDKKTVVSGQKYSVIHRSPRVDLLDDDRHRAGVRLALGHRV